LLVCCYGSGHISKKCPKRRTCSVCSGKHPTGLHGYVPKRELLKIHDTSRKTSPSGSKESPTLRPPVTVNASCSLTKGGISMCVVPVFLRHKSSSCDVLTYALLDNCSQGTFIDQELLASLSLDCSKTEITVKTLTSQVTESLDVVDGLSIKGASTHFKDWINLPKTFSRLNLPVDKEEVPTKEKLKAWPYLN